VGDGSHGGDAKGEGNGGDVPDGASEGPEEILVSNVEHLVSEDGAVVVDDPDGETVGEGGDTEHVEEGGLRGTNPLALLDEVDTVADLNGTLGNLGGDTEGLEEGGLLRTETGVRGLNVHIDGGEGTSLGGGGSPLLEDDLTGVLEVLVGEDEADVADDVGEQLLQGGVLLEATTKSLADHGVLAHEDDSLATEGDTDLVHLVGAHIVGLDEENLVVLVNELVELLEVVGLLLLSVSL